MNFQKNTLLLLACAISSFSAGSAAEACVVKWRVPYGVSGSGIMETKAGKSCATTIAHRGTFMESLVVSANPQHGSTSVDSLDHITYTPKAGYHGADSFTFTADYGQKGKSDVTLNVTVE